MSEPLFNKDLVNQVAQGFPSGLFSITNTYNNDMIIYEAVFEKQKSKNTGKSEKTCVVAMYQTNLSSLSHRTLIDHNHKLRTVFQLDFVRKIADKKEYIMTLGKGNGFIKALTDRRIHIMELRNGQKIAKTKINGKDCILNYITVDTEDLSAWSTLVGLVGIRSPIKAVYIYGTYYSRDKHPPNHSLEREKIDCSVITTTGLGFEKLLGF